MSRGHDRYLVVGLADDGDELKRVTVVGSRLAEAVDVFRGFSDWIEIYKYGPDGTLTKQPEARRCRGCGRLTPTTCVAGADPLSGYWHLGCLRRARGATTLLTSQKKTSRQCRICKAQKAEVRDCRCFSRACSECRAAYHQAKGDCTIGRKPCPNTKT